MGCRSSLCRQAIVFCVALLVPACTVAVSADEQPAGRAPAVARPRSSPDFYFGQPRGAIGFRGSWLFASAGSDIFDFVTDQLTLERSAFSAPSVSADISIRLTRRVDFVISMERSVAREGSEYRDFVDNRRLPIEQETSLRVADFSAGARMLLASRGRGVSRHAWLPNTFVPYVGAGVGAMRYEFKQAGDFIDAADLSVFSSIFESAGWTLSGHVVAGLDVRVYRKLYLTTEGRYTFASAELGPDFVDFEPIDLSGFRAGAGIRIVF